MRCERLKKEGLVLLYTVVFWFFSLVLHGKRRRYGYILIIFGMCLSA